MIAQQVIKLLEHEELNLKNMRKSYGTLSETINGLKREGYTVDFNIGNELFDL